VSAPGEAAPAALLPTVSIVTVCYNSVRTIRQTIESVLTQDYPAIEHIVVDGGSTDGTVQIVREYGAAIAEFVSEPDRGIYDAMNKGLIAARGSIIGTLNSDDLYVDSRVISDLMDTLRATGSDSVFADLVYVEQDDTAKIRRYYDCARWRPSRFRYGWMPAHPTFFIKREWYERYGLFRLDFRIAADFEMLVRLLYRGGASFAHLPRPVVKMRMGGISTRGLRHSLLLNREIVRACRINGIWTTLPLMLLKIPAKLLEMRLPGCRKPGGSRKLLR
jgi:glycosyltransferase involved in cell wall biosynthesis